ncbi:MAG: redoxin domain-containing protein [Gammaproteobacteria bacterium]
MLTVSRITKSAVAIVAGSLLASVVIAAERITDFSLIDHEGRFHQVSRYTDHDAIVLFMHNDEDRDARRAAEEYTELATQYAGQNVAFFMMDSTGLESKTEMREIAEDRDYTLPILMDDTQMVARALGLNRGAEVAVIKPASLELVFKGALNDRYAADSRARRASEHYLAQALDAVIGGSEISATQVASKADLVEYSSLLAEADAISYANDIAPIIEERCVTCHMEGGIAPFALNNHQMVQGWSPMIREVLYTKRMPPGQIDPSYVDDFYDVRNITPEETQKLISWIDNGAQNNDGIDPLLNYKLELAKWNYGEPDIVMAIPPQTVPATGVQDYRNLTVPLDIEEDVWVKAVEFVAGDTTVLHHIIAFAYGPNGVNEFELLNQGIGLGAYAPGNAINTYPENSGFPLKAGGGLLLQMHYTTSGKETVDASEIGIYLWDEEPARPVLGGSAADLEIDIAPFSKKEMVATKVFRKDSYLSMLGPHMHYRGYDANFRLRYPDGREEEVLNVPNYQFNWQKVYDFKEPLFLPAGTELVFRGTFDNTEQNPFNPDASQTLSWGEQTWQEMFFGFFRYVEAGDGE